VWRTPGGHTYAKVVDTGSTTSALLVGRMCVAGRGWPSRAGNTAAKGCKRAPAVVSELGRLIDLAERDPGPVLHHLPASPTRLWCLYENTRSDFERLVPTTVALTGPKAGDDIRVQLVNHRGGQRSYLLLLSAYLADCDPLGGTRPGGAHGSDGEGVRRRLHPTRDEPPAGARRVQRRWLTPGGDTDDVCPDDERRATGNAPCDGQRRRSNSTASARVHRHSPVRWRALAQESATIQRPGPA
jgi:hypothetical protein